jgi:hypothetical protein
MSSNPNPFEGRNLKPMLLGGVILAIIGILVFIGLWVLLGTLGFEQFPRLILSMCVPPAVIGVLLGFYVLIFRMRGTK